MQLQPLMIFPSLLLLFGCQQYGTEERVMNANCGSELANTYWPTLPPSAEQRLYDRINGFGITYISELVYNGEYMGINGGFLIDDAGLHHGAYVLQVNDGSSTWDDATVFKPLLGDSVSFENQDGVRVTRIVFGLVDLFALPDRVMTNLLFEIKNPEEATGWTKKELSRLPPRAND